MSKLEKYQNVDKSTEETAVEIDGKFSMGAKLIGKFITQKVAAAMAYKNIMKGKFKNWRKLGRIEYRDSRKKMGGGAVDAP